MARQQERTPIVVPTEDDILHTQSYPFCSDPTCPCHDDQELLSEIALAVENGLLTAEEATNLVKGRAL